MIQNNDGWWENWVDSIEEEEYWNDKTPDQRDLDPPCYCDITYVCDECRRVRRKKRMTAI